MDNAANTYTKLVDALSLIYYGPYYKEPDHMTLEQKRTIWNLAHEINNKMTPNILNNGEYTPKLGDCIYDNKRDAIYIIIKINQEIKIFPDKTEPAIIWVNGIINNTGYICLLHPNNKGIDSIKKLHLDFELKRLRLITSHRLHPEAMKRIVENQL